MEKLAPGAASYLWDKNSGVIETVCCTCGTKIYNTSNKPTPVYCSKQCFETAMERIEKPAREGEE